MNTEPPRRWRSAMTMPALFVVSFAATYWATSPPGATTLSLGLEAQTPADGPGTDHDWAAVPTMAPITVEWEPDEPALAPSPSLHELAADIDPATRDEAQALLELLDQEQLQ